MFGSESEAETSNMVTNAELAKKMQEHEKTNKWLLDEFEKLKGQMEKREKVRKRKKGKKRIPLSRRWLTYLQTKDIS